MSKNSGPHSESVRFTYLHGGENFIDVCESDADGPTRAAQVIAAVPPDLQARINAWDRRMGDAFDYRHHGEGLEPGKWPAPLRKTLTQEYTELLAELQAAGLPVVSDAWWAVASDDLRPQGESPRVWWRL